MQALKKLIQTGWLGVLFVVIVTGGLHHAKSQDQRWMRVGETQCFFFDYGSEPELAANINFLTWPTQYSDDQHVTRARGTWLGARNFYDTIEGKLKGIKVIGIGPRPADNELTMIFPQGIKLIGRYNHPQVVVDDQIGTNNTLYDVLDELDENLPCDRMIVIQFNTSLGVSVTKKVLAFTQQNHDNYFIYDYVFKNTGIVSTGIHEQALEDFWVYFQYRYAFAGVTSGGFGSTWGSFASQWGTSNLLHAFTLNDPEGMRGYTAWYGPTNSYSHPLTPEEDWGCPDYEETGVLGSAKYAGAVTLFASKSADDYWTDDQSQPRTDAYIGSDAGVVEASVSQYDENYMQQRYNIMTEGHLDHSQFEAVGDGYVETWTESDPYRNTGTTGGSTQGQGYGPYTLEPGDSIRIVFAEGVNGISWPKCREVGANWLAYYLGTGTPELVLPDGSGSTDHNAYKRAWCETGTDSILQSLRSAIDNFDSDYQMPQAPPPPSEFIVKSGGDRIRLTWADNATSHPHFDGYVIYRSEGSVKDYRSVYTQIFECDASNVVHQFDDVTANRGFNYYYYIQSKDDGTQNEVEPGRPLYSSMFLTLTSVEAYLRRPQGLLIDEVRVVPNPYDIRARKYQFGVDDTYDRIAFYELPGQCKLKIFTERGDLIWEKDHNDGSGDELWDSFTSSGQIVVSGIYILYVEVTEDIIAEEDVVARRDYYDGTSVTRAYTDSTGTFSYVPSNEPVYKKDDVLYPKGSVMYKKGESVYRKFVIIR
ncbi:hypothetical protein JW948_19015 [bacterium]|nr:hypothetical protein [bacterium]